MTTLILLAILLIEALRFFELRKVRNNQIAMTQALIEDKETLSILIGRIINEGDRVP